MFARTEALYADLAKTLGVEKLPVDEAGGVQLNVGETSAVALFAEDEFTLLLASPVMSLPRQVDYGRVLWLLRRNFYDSPIAPFRVACDQAGSVILWGRVPVEGLTGEQLGKLIDALATEADSIREELEEDEGEAAELETAD